MTTATYEFNSAQNTIFSKLAKWMTLTGWLMVTYTGLQTLGVVSGLPTQWALARAFPELRFVIFLNLTMAALLILSQLAIAIWTLTGASAFRRVVDSKGNDLSHLMVALEHLRKTYRLIYNILVGTLVLMVVWWCFNLYILRLAIWNVG